jgi:hypothetical protein
MAHLDLMTEDKPQFGLKDWREGMLRKKTAFRVATVLRQNSYSALYLCDVPECIRQMQHMCVKKLKNDGLIPGTHLGASCFVA